MPLLWNSCRCLLCPDGTTPTTNAYLILKNIERPKDFEPGPCPAETGGAQIQQKTFTLLKGLLFKT